MRRSLVAAFAVCSLSGTPALAQPIDTTSPDRLRRSLHRAIDDHTWRPYADTWRILEDADQDPASAGKILDLYHNESFDKPAGRDNGYVREHTWPRSYGFPREGGDYSFPFTDMHALFLAHGGYNGSRSNLPYRYCGWDCAERDTLPNHGRGGGTGVYVGNSNWRTGQLTTGRWETWTGRRGDVARALFYMDVRYEGGRHRDGDLEPDLVLTDDPALIATSQTNQPLAYMGLLSTLLRWHREDPVDELERRRNRAVQGTAAAPGQGNRNPFIDDPSLADTLYRRDLEIAEVVDLGEGYFPAAINNSGVVVGNYRTTGLDATNRGFIWRSGTISDLGGLNANCRTTYALGLSEAGEVVGESCVSLPDTSGQPNWYQHAYVLRGGVMVDLGRGFGANQDGRVSSRAKAVNAAGVVIGEVGSGFTFRHEGGQVSYLTVPNALTFGEELTEAGEVVGHATRIDGTRPRAFFWPRGGEPRYLTSPNTDSRAYGVNDRGQVVGQEISEAMEWWYGQPIRLGIRHTQMPNQTGAFPLAVNDGGEVVGYRTFNGYQAFYWSERAGAVVLDDLRPRDFEWQFESATDINDRGEIVGTGIRAGARRGYLLRLQDRITYAVNSVRDLPDSDLTDGRCETGGQVERDGENESECTLRAAIMQANHRGRRSFIAFDIPAVTGTPTIAVASELPPVEPPVVIDGRTQPVVRRVEISGQNQGAGWHGLQLQGGASDVAGLVVNRFTGDGLVLSDAGRNRVVGSYLGTSADGRGRAANAGCGLRIVRSAENTIGGPDPLDRNVLSGNLGSGLCIEAASNTAVSGNLVGLDVSGRVAVRNDGDGIRIAGSDGTRIGNPGGFQVMANFIAGNGANGVSVAADARRTMIVGAAIGTDIDGAAAVANAGAGVLAQGPETAIGGMTSTDRNLISGNGASGVEIRGAAAEGVTVRGNFIGSSRDGRSAVRNTVHGVLITNGASRNTIGGPLATAAARPGTPPGNLISGNGQHGVAILNTEAQAQPAAGNIVSGNLVGLQTSGRLLLRNGGDGVHLGPGSNAAVIGGREARARNVLSGNLAGVFVGKATAQDMAPFGHEVLGNLIGTNADGGCIEATGGGCAYGNRIGVKVADASSIKIGDAAATVGRAPGNLISNNEEDGIAMAADAGPDGANGVLVAGNLIGTNVAGTGPLANGRHGVSILGSGSRGAIRIGPDTPGRNVISGNRGHGVLIGDDAASATAVILARNYIGVDITGQVTDPDQDPNNGNELGNGSSGVAVLRGTEIDIGLPAGGAACGTICNVISGNKEHGVLVTGEQTSGVDVFFNRIGVDVAGVLGLGNRRNGVLVARGAQGVRVHENFVSGNGRSADMLLGQDGIAVDSQSQASPVRISIQRNTVGLNVDRTLTIPNEGTGVLSSRAREVEIKENWISGNRRFGVHVQGGQQVTIESNEIGLDRRPLSNSAGLLVEAGATQVTIGGPGQANPPVTPRQGNVIFDGVFTREPETLQVSVIGNDIQVPGDWTLGLTPIGDAPPELSGQASLLPLDLGADGPNCPPSSGGSPGRTPAPRLMKITVAGVEGLTEPGAQVEILQAPRAGEARGRGRYFAASVISKGVVTADGVGKFSWTGALDEGSMVAATATVAGRTSELSQLKRPMIFLPGAGGSELRAPPLSGGIIWVPCCTTDNVHDRIDKLDPNTLTGSSLTVHDIVTDLEQIPGIVYHPGLTWLAESAQGYNNTRRNQDPLTLDLWRFAFDWRLHPAATAVALQAMVDDAAAIDRPDRAESCEVDIVAHSLGGIVASLYVRSPSSAAHARQKVHRMVTVGTPYLGTPQAAEALTDGYIFGLQDPLLYRVTFTPDWGRIITATRTLPVAYLLMPSRRYWQALPNAAYLDDPNATGALQSYDDTFAMVTGTNALLGLGGNGGLWSRMESEVHDITDDWTGYRGPPQIFRIVGDQPEPGTARRWIYDGETLRRPIVDNDSPAVKRYRERQNLDPGLGDGTVLLGSAMLGRGQGGTDFSGVGTGWIEEFIRLPCAHVALAADPQGCRSLGRIIEILKSGYTALNVPP